MKDPDDKNDIPLIEIAPPSWICRLFPFLLLGGILLIAIFTSSCANLIVP